MDNNTVRETKIAKDKNGITITAGDTLKIRDKHNFGPNIPWSIYEVIQCHRDGTITVNKIQNKRLGKSTMRINPSSIEMDLSARQVLSRYKEDKVKKPKPNRFAPVSTENDIVT